VVTVGVVIARAPSTITTTTIAQKEAKWGGDSNGTTRCHCHHYLSMKLFESPKVYENLPCLRILGEV
jgi:hypothetical protein